MQVNIFILEIVYAISFYEIYISVYRYYLLWISITTFLYMLFWQSFSASIAHKTFTLLIKHFCIRSTEGTYIHVNYPINIAKVRRLLYDFAWNTLIYLLNVYVLLIAIYFNTFFLVFLLIVLLIVAEFLCFYSTYNVHIIDQTFLYQIYSCV